MQIGVTIKTFHLLISRYVVGKKEAAEGETQERSLFACPLQREKRINAYEPFLPFSTEQESPLGSARPLRTDFSGEAGLVRIALAQFGERTRWSIRECGLP
jgi:hypothetical protein